MKALLTRVFRPVLSVFETDQAAANYKPSHRLILNIVGVLFLFLSSVSVFAAINTGVMGGMIPGVVFFVVGATAIIVGTLGSDNAVAKIWGNRS